MAHTDRSDALDRRWALVVGVLLGAALLLGTRNLNEGRDKAHRTDVLLLGDCIMLMGGTHAVPLLRAEGLSVVLDAHGGTSPIGKYPGNIDWVSRTYDIARRLNPHTVMIMFNGNYPRVVRMPEDRALCRKWGVRVRSMVEALQEVGTRRILVAESVPGQWSFQPDDVFKCESAALQGSPAELVDVGGVVGALDSPRTRVEALPSCDGGADVVMRTADVHVTDAGARRIARRLASLVDRRVPPPPPSCAER
jgi:hypothetical protein